MKSLKKIIISCFVLILIFIISTTTYENIRFHVKLNNFLEDQILLDSKSDDLNKYYYKTNAAYYDNNYMYPGSFCDILVTTDSSVEVPVIHSLLDLTVGGHAGLCAMYYADKYYTITDYDSIDTAYNETDNKTTIYPKNRWNDYVEFPSFFILRVNLTSEQMYTVFNEVVSSLGDPYNLTFLLDTKNKSYCSDLISKAFRKIDINLNYDFGATTVIDLLESKYTEIVGYKTRRNGINYFYIN